MNDFKRLVSSWLEFETPAEEQRFTDYVLNEVEHQRKLMGYEKDKYFRPNSLFAKWMRYQSMWEQDFSHRAKDGESLFSESNYSLNLPMTQISQHSDKIGNDLMSSPAFFGPMTEGPEDQSPAVEILKRRLLHRSKKISLHETGKRGTLGALIRGQEILRPSYSESVYLKPTKVSATMLAGKEIKDSQGQPIIFEQDKWIKDPARPDMKVLERDPMIAVPAEAVFEPGKSRIVMQRKSQDAGCDVKPVHFADFFTVFNAETLEDAHIKGHAFRANPGDMLTAYAPENLMPEAKEYLKKHLENALMASTEIDYVVQAPLTNPKKGEDDELTENIEGEVIGRHRKRSFYEVWIRYDANKDGYDEDIYCLIDVNEKICVHYEYAHIILPWAEMPHPHPYVNFRIWPQMHRWTGSGYYELLEVWAEIVDKMLNRMEIDSNKSGNVVFENPLATVEGMDGTGVQFRSNMAYELRPGFTAQEALQSIRVEPANLDVFNSIMDQFIRRVQVQGGITSPQDAETAGLPGSNTLGGLKIMEQSGNQGIRSREAEILVGLTALLHAFADIEIYAITNDPTPLIKQVGENDAMILLEWLKANPGEYRNVFEVSLTKAHSSQMIENGQAILQTLEAWKTLDPGYKPLHMPAYRKILQGLDEPNPDILLNLEASLAADAAAAEAMMMQSQATQQPK